jgi:hypothetical protein
MRMSRERALQLASAVTAIDVLVASLFAIAGLVRPASILPASNPPTDASFILALYAAARTLPLAVVALAAIWKRSIPSVLILGALAGIIQVMDAGIGLFQHDIGKTAGPLTIAAVQLFAIMALKKSERAGR